jgi:hypothetical protein
MAKTKYSVTFNGQTFTRSTERTYSHMVIGLRSGAEYAGQYGDFGWSGRLDLAQKNFQYAKDHGCTDAAILDTATGEVVVSYHVDPKTAQIAAARTYLVNRQDEFNKMARYYGPNSRQIVEFRESRDKAQAALDALLAE